MNNRRQRSITRFSTLLVASGALLLFTSPVAMAAAPRDSKRLIVPGASIGSVQLGQEPRAARAGWGGGKCRNPGPYENNESPEFNPDSGPGECSFTARRRGYAGFDVSDEPVVRKISIGAWLLRVRQRFVGRPPNGRLDRVPTFAFERPYTSFRTAKGIKLGSTVKAFRRAYPRARRLGDPGNFEYDSQEYAIKQGKTRTIFEVAGGRVAGIEMTLIEP